MVGVAVTLNDECITYHHIDPPNVWNGWLRNNPNSPPLKEISDTSLTSRHRLCIHVTAEHLYVFGHRCKHLHRFRPSKQPFIYCGFKNN